MSTTVILLAALAFSVPGFQFAAIEQENYDYWFRSGDEDYYSEDVPMIYDKPDFVTQGQTINVEEGASVQLSCQVNDLYGNQMIWVKTPGVKHPEDILYLSDKEVTPDSRRSLALIEDNQGTILTISQATEADEGTYICMIDNPDYYYELQLEFTLSVRATNLSVGASEVSGKDGNGVGLANTASIS